MSPAAPLAIFGGIGFSEMLVIAFIAILVFGGRLPDVLRNLGQAYARVRRSLQDMSRPLREELQRATTLPPDPAPPSLPAPAPMPGTMVPYEVGTDGLGGDATGPFPTSAPERPTPPAPPPTSTPPAPWLDEQPPV